MSKQSRIIGCTAIALAVVWMGSCIVQRERPVYAKWKLKWQLQKIEAWTGSTNYSADGWRQLAQIAQAFQEAAPPLAGEALAEHLQDYAGPPGRLAVEQGKLFLLLRMVFDLPEHAPPGQRVFDHWTRGGSDVNGDGSVNLAWPLSLDQGRPRLVTGCAGTAGSGYSVRDEYTYLRYKFKYRDLSGFRAAD